MLVLFPLLWLPLAWGARFIYGETKVTKGIRSKEEPPSPNFICAETGDNLGNEVELFSRAHDAITESSRVTASLSPAAEAQGKYLLSLSVSGLGGVYHLEDNELILPESINTHANRVLVKRWNSQQSLVLFIRLPQMNADELKECIADAVALCKIPLNGDCLTNLLSGRISIAKPVLVKMNAPTLMKPPPSFVSPPPSLVSRPPPSRSTPPIKVMERKDLDALFLKVIENHDLDELFRILRMPQMELRSIPPVVLTGYTTVVSTLMCAQEWRELLRLTKHVMLDSSWLSLLKFFLNPTHHRGVKKDGQNGPMVLHFQATIEELREMPISADVHRQALEAIILNHRHHSELAALLRSWLQVYGGNRELCEQIVRLSPSVIGSVCWAEQAMCGWRMLKGQLAEREKCKLSPIAWNALILLEGQLEYRAFATDFWRSVFPPEQAAANFTLSLSNKLDHVLIVLLQLYPQIMDDDIKGLSLTQLLIAMRYVKSLDVALLEPLRNLNSPLGLVARFYLEHRNLIYHPFDGNCGEIAEQQTIAIDLERLEQLMEPVGLTEITAEDRDAVCFGKLDFQVVPATMAYLLTGMSLAHILQFRDDEALERGDLIHLINWRNRHYCKQRGGYPRRLLHGHDARLLREIEEEKKVAQQAKKQAVENDARPGLDFTAFMEKLDEDDEEIMALTANVNSLHLKPSKRIEISHRSSGSLASSYVSFANLGAPPPPSPPRTKQRKPVRITLKNSRDRQPKQPENVFSVDESSVQIAKKGGVSENLAKMQSNFANLVKAYYDQ